MKYIILLTALLIFPSINSAQEQDSIPSTPPVPTKVEPVVLKERITGKRKGLYLKNNGNISYTVLFALHTDDFIVNNLNATSTITLLPETEVKVASLVLKDGITEGNYTHTLQVSEAPYELDLKKDAKYFNARINQALSKKDIVIFGKSDCDLCVDIKKILKRSRVKFKHYKHDKDTDKLNALLSTHAPHLLGGKTYAPVIKIGESFYTQIKTPRDLIMALDENMH